MQRRSVFPPLLKTYAEDASAVASPGRGPETRLVSVAASGGKKNPESNRSGTDVGRQAPPGSLQRRERKPAKKSVLRDSREAELRMKRAEVDACSSHKHCLGVHAKWCACQVAYTDDIYQLCSAVGRPHQRSVYMYATRYVDLYLADIIISSPLQKADTLVKEWDAMLLKDKEDKHSQLLQRLELQHRLIAKNDLLAQEARYKEEEKQAKVTCIYNYAFS